jgi:rRNA pseudouridine-1189 N-methylase Emg1 (Nep1/Mra1 family)
MGNALKQAIAAYRNARNEERARRVLLSTRIDYNYLRDILNSLADDQQKLKITIKMTDGTVLEIARDTPKNKGWRDPYEEVIQ